MKDPHWTTLISNLSIMALENAVDSEGFITSTFLQVFFYCSVISMDFFPSREYDFSISLLHNNIEMGRGLKTF